MIKLENISKSYGSFFAVKNFSTEIFNSSTTVLIGPSGCGKSTIIRLLTGLTKPDEGKAAINGTKISDGSIEEIRRNLGYVIQDGGLFPHLNISYQVDLVSILHLLIWLAFSKT